MVAPSSRLAKTLGAAAAAVALLFVAANEGRRNEPYRDIGGVWTVCDGQTGVPMRYYTDGECDAMLSAALESRAESMQASTPQYATWPDGVRIAMLDFDYNVGHDAWLRSTLRKRAIAGDLPGACDEFLRWRFVGQTDCSVDRRCAGVWTRRQAERAMCRGEAQ